MLCHFQCGPYICRATLMLKHCVSDAASGVFCHFSFIISIADSLRSSFFPLPASVWTWCSGQLFSHSSECLPLPGTGYLCQNTNGPGEQPHRSLEGAVLRAPREDKCLFLLPWQVPGSLCVKGCKFESVTVLIFMITDLSHVWLDLTFLLINFLI